jgi:protein arginine kinase activator
MKCENCGKNDANVKYTQIINGEKKQMFLCEECSEKLGINDIHFNMPINFTSFLTDFFDDMNDVSFMPTLGKANNVECSKCGLTWDNFLHTGKFGCSNCYDDFEQKIDPILRSLQGANQHVGRIGSVIEGNDIKQNLDDISEKEENKTISKIEKLKEDLKVAIKEERYEDAAKIRDEIKKEEEK